MMSDDEIIAVVQAHKEGKRIEYLCGNQWAEVTRSAVWGHFATYAYRVAPEPRKPREWKVPLDYLWCGQDLLKCDPSQPREGPVTWVRVREVIE